MSEPQGIDVRELGENASRYVAMAMAGQRIPVTEHGEVVAYLVPAEESRSVYQQKVDAGQMRPATGDVRRYVRDNPRASRQAGRANALCGAAGDA